METSDEEEETERDDSDTSLSESKEHGMCYYKERKREKSIQRV